MIHDSERSTQQCVHIRPFHRNQILEIHIAPNGFLVLGPIETNVRKCVLPNMPPDLEFVATVATGGRVKFLSAV